MDYSKKLGKGFRDNKTSNKEESETTKRFSRKSILKGLTLFFSTLVLVLTGRYVWREYRFRYIIIHHTASDVGNLEYYRKLHREERGWPDLAYHFLINNGSSDTAVGQVVESNIWKDRSHGYSTQSTEMNYFGIAIVMVGNFQEHPPHPLQLESLIQLCINLSRKFNIEVKHIVGHKELQATACPGKYIDLNLVRERIQEGINSLMEQESKPS